MKNMPAPSMNPRRREINLLLSKLIFSLIFGVGVVALYVHYFAPEDFLKHPVDYFFSSLILEGKKTLSTPIQKDDIHAVARAAWHMDKQRTYWYFTLAIIGAVSTSLFSLNAYFIRRQRIRKENEVFHRGSKLLSSPSHRKFMKRHYPKTGPNSMGTHLLLGKEKLLIPEPIQYQHFAFIGASGYGKTTAIEEIITHARSHNQRCLIMDLGGSFYRKFGQENDHVLSLTHPKAEAWDFWGEAGMRIEAMSAALIEEKQNSHPFFTKAARALTTALIETNNSLGGIISDLENSNAELKAKLKSLRHMALKIIGEDADEQTDGVIASVATETRFLRDLATNNASQKPFSLSSWVKDSTSKSWVFLVVEEDALEHSKSLLRLWFDLACLSILKRIPEDPHNDHLWFILDEVKSLGFLPSLPAILDKGRKYKSSVILGLQSISQLNTIYGLHDAASILQGLQSQFFFRIGEIKCAEYASAFLGNEDIEQTSYSSSFEPDYLRERDSISHARTRRPLVLPEELRNLPHLKAYAKLAHHHPVLLSFEPMPVLSKERESTQEVILEPEKPLKLLPFQQHKKGV